MSKKKNDFYLFLFHLSIRLVVNAAAAAEYCFSVDCKHSKDKRTGQVYNKLRDSEFCVTRFSNFHRLWRFCKSCGNFFLTIFILHPRSYCELRDVGICLASWIRGSDSAINLCDRKKWWGTFAFLLVENSVCRVIFFYLYLKTIYASMKMAKNTFVFIYFPIIGVVVVVGGGG